MPDKLSDFLTQIAVIIDKFFDWLRNLSSKGDSIRCQRCQALVQISPNQRQDLYCYTCTFMIPITYARDSNTPPIFIQLFGLPGTGKTTFLDMLRLHLYDMDQVWPGFYERPLTQLDADHKHILLTERRQGKIPGSTPKRERNQNEVYIMYLHYMERWRSCFLILMDHAGEYFRQLNVPM